MSTGAGLVTDYLVVGAGANGMGFVDSLLEHSDADVVMIDRHHAPGGHWLDSYPFIQLHQPSFNYGVDSVPLGRDRVEPRGRDAGFYERASGAEICAYYDEIMRHRMLASGRVRFFPMCDYLGDRRFRSRLTGDETDVSVRRSVVDATYMASHVPATDPPAFKVAEGVSCLPVGALTSLTEAPAGFVIIGGGKTSMDAACWLLDRGTPPEEIIWIRPRDSWILNRAFFQPGPGVVSTFEGIVIEIEAVVECDSIEQVFGRLEEREIVFRIDQSIQPSMLKGATSSRGEVDQLRRIERVVRLGHVKEIHPDTIELDDGSIPTSPDWVHVHCASAGLPDNPPRPVFAEEQIVLQPISRVSLSWSAALIGLVEASGRTVPEKNRLCQPNPWPHTPFDWVRHILTGMRTELEWDAAPEVTAWVVGSRLNLVKGLDAPEHRGDVADLQNRFLTALFPALAKLETLASSATPAERARMVAVGA